MSPTALVFETANMDFATGARADKLHLGYLCNGADVLLLQECKNISVQALLPDGWRALQDRSSKAKAGVAIAYRTDRVEVLKWHLWLGVKPFIKSRRIGMLERWIIGAQLRDKRTDKRYWALSAHLPPKRFKALQPLMMGRIKRIVSQRPIVVLGADFNQYHRDAAKFLGLKPHGYRIDGILTGPHIQTAGAVEFHFHGKKHDYTDHPTIRVPLRSVVG